jgi:hypothetical protein
MGTPLLPFSGVPQLLTISQMKNTPELCSAMIQFPTVKVNGIFGTFDYPAMSCGMLKKQKHRDALIAYVKTVLPDAHPLSRKGWRELPPGVCTLPEEVAAPGGPPLQRRSQGKAAPKGGKGKGRKRPRLAAMCRKSMK